MSPQDPATPPPITTRRRFSSDALLWCSAMVLAGLLLVQSGRAVSGWPGAAAHADVVSRVGDFTTLTLNAQSSEDILVVLDGRGEQMFTYRIRNQKQVELIKRYDLAQLFLTGQRLGAGRAR